MLIGTVPSADGLEVITIERTGSCHTIYAEHVPVGAGPTRMCVLGWRRDPRAAAREATIAAFSLGGLLDEDAAALLCQPPNLEAIEECWPRHWRRCR